MVNLPICCSEHEASMCFSEHGGTLLMSLRSWSEPRRRGAGLLQIGELLSWMSSTIDGRVASLSLGNNMVFFIGLRELHRSIKFLVEFGVGRRLVAWAIKLPCCCTLDSDDLEVDETLRPWWGLVGVRQKFVGEAGNVFLKGDASAHTQDACAASVAILGLTVASCLVSGLYLDFWQGGRSAWDLLVYLFDSKSPPSGRLSLIASIGMQHIPPSVDRLLVNFPQEIACLSYGPKDSIAGSWDRTEPWYCFRTLRCCWDPEVSLESEGRFWSPEAALDPEVTFKTCIDFLQTSGRTPASGSPLGGTPGLRYEVLRIRS
ncbi:hypothetical protein F2Q69_00006459 [Brassica cretica]|uniref:Uncharacterized protein n=1 Tax=Brassica cretica TaxID=69181 RepID=A0A8S9P6K7_BRACR|nr:hypothetical protein F2Q69_00006459 [Brassica cretica]